MIDTQCYASPCQNGSTKNLESFPKHIGVFLVGYRLDCLPALFDVIADMFDDPGRCAPRKEHNQFSNFEDTVIRARRKKSAEVEGSVGISPLILKSRHNSFIASP